MTSIYNGQFSGNILLVGKTGYGKIMFLVPRKVRIK